MIKKPSFELFSTGCQICLAAIEQVKELACRSGDVQVLDRIQDDDHPHDMKDEYWRESLISLLAPVFWFLGLPP